MNAGKSWTWALPGMLLAAACLAQPPSASAHAVRRQLQQVRKNVAGAQAQVRDLKQQIRQARQHNTDEKAQLAARDREIARLKAQLAKRQAGGGTAAGAGHGH